jgi:hypothetical protein
MTEVTQMEKIVYYYTTDETALWSRSSRAWVAKQAREGKLDSVLIGGRYLISRSAVARLVGFEPPVPKAYAASC